jgi:hypothetical protein
MGTFHKDRGELHGITVVVDTAGPDLYIGRCDTVTDTVVRLVDVVRHRNGEGGLGKADFLARAARLGYQGRERSLDLPLADVVSIRRLGDIAREARADGAP